MNPIAAYIAMDAETGGLDAANHSLLTIYFKVMDSEFNKIGDLSLAIKPEDGTYRVTAKALDVNKIDLIRHDATALTPKEAGRKLYEFLNEVTNEGANKPSPLGHNVAFDINYVVTHLLDKKTWEKMVSYRVIDTATVGRFLMDAGYIPQTVSGGLRGFATFFSIEDNAAHTAEGDVDVTVDVYRGMLNLVNHGNGDY